MKEGLLVFCDGGARGNPGPAAIAFVVFQNGKIIHQFSQKIGKTTNNVAEYRAVIAALEWLNHQPSIVNHQPSINFYLDSQLIVNQLNGRFKIKNSGLQNLVIRVKNLERKIEKKINYQYVNRGKNKIADALVNQSLNGL